MRWAIFAVLFYIGTSTADAAMNAERIRERVRKAIAHLRTAKAVGEFAINTPFGLIPLKDITEQNLPDVFRFRKEFDEMRKLEAAQKLAAATLASDEDLEGSGIEGSGFDSLEEEEEFKRKRSANAHSRMSSRRAVRSVEAAYDEPLLTP